MHRPSLRPTLTNEVKKQGPAHFQKILNLWYAYNFFLASIKDGLAPFVSVYLVAYAGVSPGAAGLIWFVKDISQMVSQIPMGVFVDRTTHKKAFLVFFTLLTALLPVTIVFTQNIPFLIAKSVLEGIGSTGIMVFKGPFTLGISGHENFEHAAKHTEISEHGGSLVVFSIAGIIGYFCYPNVLPIFYVIGVFGSVAALCLVLMVPKENHLTVVNDDLARNSRHNIFVSEHPTEDDDKSPTNAYNFFKKGDIESKGDDDDDDEGGMSPSVVSSSSLTDPSMGILESESIWNIFITNPAMTFFTLSVFFFHFGNAAVLPLLGQVLAIEEGRNGIPFTAALIVIAQMSSMGGVYMFDFFANRGYTINVPIIIGFGAIIPRICCILFLLNFYQNPYALLATQIFDGLGAGVNGLGILRVTKTLTENTNRFGVVFSIATSGHACGAALSNLVSGYLVDLTSYEVAMATLLAPGVLCLIFLSVTKIQPPPTTTTIAFDGTR